MSRQQIIAIAKTFVGSHYLWGSGGDMPEYDNGVYYASSTVCMAPSSTDISFPNVFAAQLNRSQEHRYGVYVCAGRCKRLGDRTAAIVDPSYVNYMDSLRETPEPLWDPHEGMSPRIARGGNIGANDGRPVWGEDCRNKRHFDCDSFVNYVLSHTTNKSWGFTQPQYMTMSKPDYWTTIDPAAPPVDGDILLKAGHVALLSADNHVVQAQQHDTGVHADEGYNAASWTKRLHPLDSVI